MKEGGWSGTRVYWEGLVGTVWCQDWVDWDKRVTEGVDWTSSVSGGAGWDWRGSTCKTRHPLTSSPWTPLTAETWNDFLTRTNPQFLLLRTPCIRANGTGGQKKNAWVFAIYVGEGHRPANHTWRQWMSDIQNAHRFTLMSVRGRCIQEDYSIIGQQENPHFCIS